jgi:hypothetical protein
MEVKHKEFAHSLFTDCAVLFRRLDYHRSKCMLIGLGKLFSEGERNMSGLMRKSVPQKQREQKVETRTAAGRIAGFTIVATAVAALAVLVASALHAQGQGTDKYSLISPGGIAFSDFRGYEDWAVVSSASTTNEVLKVIVGNLIEV